MKQTKRIHPLKGALIFATFSLVSISLLGLGNLSRAQETEREPSAAAKGKKKAAQSAGTSEKAPAPAAILAKADRARGGLSEGLVWKITVRAVEDGSTTNTDYDVKVKGVNVIASCTAPPRQRGETYLFNDRSLWVFRPGLRKPVSVSPRQRLTGNAANGDIATTNYARDYDATVVGEEAVNGKKAWKLALKAKAKDVTYDGINYWVSMGDFLGLRAEFLTLDGKVLKQADFEYKNQIQADGKRVPFISKMKITDPAFPGNETTIEYMSPNPAELNDSVFNVNNLAR